MHKWLLLLLVLFAYACKQSSEQLPLRVEAYSLLEGSLAVVPSLSMEGDHINTSSNIFLIRGTNDTVWIFGNGYGDGNTSCEECNDYTFYRGADFQTAANAIDDARNADSIITRVWGISKEQAIIRFIAPHFHADHLNAEFVSAIFDSLGYVAPESNAIFVHRSDSAGAICNTPCCETAPCPDKDNPFYAAPYQPGWSPQQLDYFAFFGSESDSCNQVGMEFTSTTGNWQVCKGTARADGGHTDGTVNLQNHQLQLRIAGTLNRPQCNLPAAWQTVYVHGNAHWPSNSD